MPLHIACMYGVSLKLIRAFTAKGGEAAVNLQDTNNDGSSALHLACENIPKHGDSMFSITPCM